TLSLRVAVRDRAVRIVAPPPRAGPGTGARALEGRRRPEGASCRTSCARGGDGPDAGDLLLRLGKPYRSVHHALWTSADDADEHPVCARTGLGCPALAVAQR